MLAPTDFPSLQLCKVCSSFFTGHIDESTGEDVHRWIWYEGKEYAYTRTRRDVEQAAVSGCLFCEIILCDRRYAKSTKNGKAPQKIETEAVFRLEKQRPIWFPPLDEKLYFQIQYDQSRSSLTTTLGSKTPARTVLESGQYRYDWDLYFIKSDPAAQLVREEALIMEPRSSEVFKEALEWMNNCLNNHAECPRNKPVKLPAKLVRISPPGDPEWAKVWESNGMEGQYCALSYCWGQDQEHKTLISRYEQYKKELPYLKLPKTITDAFQVARGMGMEQIWIDSLCIVQDDEEDKQREIAKMMSIYQEAKFTISAACASEVTEGFLRNPLESRTGFFYHPLRINKDQTGSVIVTPMGFDQAEPINNRGWTLQESLLTPRLLIFTDLMTVLKCHRGYQPSYIIPKNRSIFQRKDSQSSDAWENWYQNLGYIPISIERWNYPVPAAPRIGKKLRDGTLLDDWHSIIDQYTRRRLSMSRDRLPAISAVARAFAPRMDCPYYAGLWDKFLIYDLTWSIDPGQPGPSFRSAAPSWSWAAVFGKSCEYRFRNDIVRAEVISCNTTLVSESNPYGEVSAGKLEIRGHLQQVWIIPGTAFSPLFDKGGNKYHSSCFIDDEIASPPPDPTDASDDERTEAWCLVLIDNPGDILCDGRMAPVSNSCVMMVLAKIAWKENLYKRIGIANAEDKRPPYWWEASGRVKVTII